NIGSVTANVPVSANLTGLSANTTYNFQIMANRGATTYNGANKTFTTAAPPPTCITVAASDISYNSATLNGTVNPNGFATTAYFNYGLTTSYTVTTTEKTMGSGTSNVAINEDISVSASSPYNFRVVGTNANGTTYGTNLTFDSGATPGSAPTCTTDLATNVTYDSATLNGKVNPNQVDTNAFFNYGLTTSYTITTTAQSIGIGIISIAVAETVNGLTPNTPYYFRVGGTSTAGTRYGGNLTFNTGLPPPTCTTNNADNITPDSATLKGAVNPNGLYTTYYFNYDLTTSYTVTTTAQPIGNGTSDVTVNENINGLSATTTYNFRVVGNNSAGTTYGDNLTFDTLTPVGVLPTCTTTAASSITLNSARLNGTVNPNGFTTTAYFNYGLTITDTNTTTQEIGSGTGNVAVSATVSSLSSSTLYYFRVVGQNSAGTVLGGNLTFTTLSSGSAPTCITLAASNIDITNTSATLNGTVNPNGLTTTAYFQWEWGRTTTPDGNTTPEQPIGSGTSDVPVSANIVFPGEGIYSFRVAGNNTAGTAYGSNRIVAFLIPIEEPIEGPFD
ncbi:MAG: hypothetical protein V1709_05680, partial [Planctomycetota bacterium]